MVNRFRRLRKNLLSDSKFRKYTGYALGEIILVVIGILIALQVNNLNEAWKEQRLIDLYQDRLVEDIIGDLNAVQMRIRYYETVRSYAEKALNFLNEYESKSSYLEIDADILEDAIIAFMLASNKWTYIPGKNTYDDLTSNGKIHLLGDIDERQIVVDYYRELNQKMSYWEVPLSYQRTIRSLIHNDLQEAILASCESFTGSPIMSGTLERECRVDLNPKLVHSSLYQILKEKELAKSLTYLISHYRTSLKLFKEQEQSATDIIQMFKTITD